MSKTASCWWVTGCEAFNGVLKKHSFNDSDIQQFILILLIQSCSRSCRGCFFHIQSLLDLLCVLLLQAFIFAHTFDRSGGYIGVQFRSVTDGSSLDLEAIDDAPHQVSNLQPALPVALDVHCNRLTDTCQSKRYSMVDQNQKSLLHEIALNPFRKRFTVPFSFSLMYRLD